MGKKQKNGRGKLNLRLVQDTTLREENTGKKHVELSSILKVEHLQKVATWACLEAKIPSLGAFYGRQLAATAEAEGVPLDPSIFLCERCESILEPGNNCTMRIEKNAKKSRRSKKSHMSFQNSLVYKCHFCGHPNRMNGTPKGYVKELLASRDSHSTLECPNKVLSSSIQKCSSDKVTDNRKHALDDVTQDAEPIFEIKRNCPEVDAAVTDNRKHALDDVTQDAELIFEIKRNCPEVDAAAVGVSCGEETPLTLLDKLAHSSKKKRKIKATHDKTLNSGTSPVTSVSGEGTLGSIRRKRKGWSSLKEIAENNEAESSKSINNFAIPFVLNVAK